MKKILAMLLAVVMVLSLAACTSGNPDPTQTASEPPASQPGTEESTEPSQAPTEEPPAPAGDNPDDIADTMTSSDNKYQVAFITDVGQLKDKSFNQGTFDGVKLYAAANGKSYKYYQPANGDAATDDDRYDAMKAAVEKALRSWASPVAAAAPTPPAAASATASCRAPTTPLRSWARPLISTIPGSTALPSRLPPSCRP